MTRVALGVVAGAHGVRGLLRVRSYTAVPEDVVAYGPVETPDGRQLALRIVGRGKGVLLVEAGGVADRDAADALKGAELLVDRAVLPPTEAEEFYHTDLVGLRAEMADGTAIGLVVAVHDFGAGDLLEIRIEGTRRTELLRFDRQTVPEADTAGGRVVVVPPDGWMDTPAREAES